jgi:hypothetical protein
MLTPQKEQEQELSQSQTCTIAELRAILKYVFNLEYFDHTTWVYTGTTYTCGEIQQKMDYAKRMTNFLSF